MIKVIVGLIIFIIGILYAIKTVVEIAKFGYDKVPYLDLSEIIKGLALPIPLVISLCIAIVGILLSFSATKKEKK
ncbi:MAG: hypothetical protein RMJ67_06275 [Elusimicrobiota bacterium]|nr:hypothetical protein [Endomicrobiia bacterium]MDW8166099.1 hypothetical protein [Elusimicrobiota bacterium]